MPRSNHLSLGQHITALPEPVSDVMGDVPATSRHIVDPQQTLALTDAVDQITADAIRAIDPGDSVEQGLAMAIVVRTEGHQLSTALDALTPAEAANIVQAQVQRQVDLLPQSGQEAFSTLDNFLDIASQTEIDDFIDDLVGAMTRNWDSPALNADELTALYRATDPDQTLSDTELVARHNDGLRYDPASPNTRPRIEDLACQPFSPDSNGRGRVDSVPSSARHTSR